MIELEKNVAKLLAFGNKQKFYGGQDGYKMVGENILKIKNMHNHQPPPHPVKGNCIFKFGKIFFKTKIELS